MDREKAREMGIDLAASIKTHLRGIHDDRNLEGERWIWQIKRAWTRRQIESFGDLHDYCDANTLGGSELVWANVNRVEPRRGRREFEQDVGDEVFVQNCCDVFNDAQDEVDRWIRAGGLYI